MEYKEKIKSRTVQGWADDLSEKGYYLNNLELYYFSIVFSVVCQILTIYSSFNFVFSFVKSYYFTSFVLVLVEVLKFVLFKSIFKAYFINPKNVNLLFLSIALLICALSIFASVTGAEQIGNDKTQLITIENAMRSNALNVDNAFRSESETLKNSISDIKKRNTWENQTYIVGKDKAILERAEMRLLQLSEDKRNALSKIETDKRNALSKKESELINNGTRYKLAFAFFDLFFIALTYYIWYFKSRAVHEYNELDKLDFSNNTEIKPVFKIEEKPKNDFQKVAKIGFKTENILNVGNRICGSCGKAFVYKTAHQTSCSTACRMSKFKSKMK